MAPLPENSTARVFVDYNSVGIQHTLMFRLGSGATAVEALFKAQDLVAVLKNRLFDSDSFYAARFSAEGSDFSLPLTWTPVAGTGGTTENAWAQDPESTFLSFIGRGSATARRFRLEFFTGLKTTVWPTDNRYNPGDAAPIDTLRINFTTWVSESDGPSSQVVTIGNDIPTMYGYVNIAQNAYWQRKQRG